MTDEFEDSDVRDLFDAIPRSESVDIRVEGHHEISLTFEVGEYDARDNEKLWGMWTFTFNTYSRNMWLHKREDGDLEEVWENKRRY